jgi:hypothetical protein
MFENREYGWSLYSLENNKSLIPSVIPDSKEWKGSAGWSVVSQVAKQ